jgi:uncharacterized membrane protein YccC
VESQDELTEIRSGRGWRAAVWGLRILLLGFTLVVVGVILLATGLSAGDGLAGLGIAAVLIGAVLGFVGAITATPKTSRYSGVATGNTSIPQTRELVRAAIKDTLGSSMARTQERP